jgi:hypothetical protein
MSTTRDADFDGILDKNDLCLFTNHGDMVNADGCSIVQLCPAYTDYKNHGAYVSCISKTAEEFIEEGLISESEKDATVSVAAKSGVGKKNKK